MEKTDKKIFIILITVLVIAFGIYNISFIDNSVKTKAILIDYKYVEYYNDEDVKLDGWYGIYKFTADNKDYEFKGKIQYEFKKLVPKTATIIYNSENPDEFREKNLPSILIVVSVIVGISAIETIAKNKKRIKE